MRPIKHKCKREGCSCDLYEKIVKGDKIRVRNNKYWGTATTGIRTKTGALGWWVFFDNKGYRAVRMVDIMEVKKSE